MWLFNFNWLKKKKKSQITEPLTHQLLPANRILGRLFEIWPDINPSIIFKADRIYVMPSKEEVKKLLFDSQIEKYVHTAYSISAESGLFDCDDFALLLQAYVIRDRYEKFQEGKISQDQLYPLAFGQIWYRDPRIGSHAINICITHDAGILLIEPQQDKIWKADKDTIVDFVRF